MRTLKFLVAFFICGIATAAISHAETEMSADKRAEIERMLTITGMENMMDQMATQIMTQMRSQSPNVPQDFLDKFEAKFRSNSLLERIIPIYDKYYSIEDLRAVNEFYSTPAGQKIIATLPQVMAEAMKVGEEWGTEMALEVLLEIQKEKSEKKSNQNL